MRVKRVLGNLSPPEWAAAALAVAPRLLDLIAVSKARTVMLYSATPRELDVAAAAKTCWEQGLRVCLPRAGWEHQTITPALVEVWGETGGENLSAGRHGIREPAETARSVDLGEIDVVVVPGLAFDARGGRLGRGGGFYDRFLARPELRAWKVGAAMDEQVVDDVPRDAWDVGLDALVTPTRTLVFSPGSGPRGGVVG